MLPTKQVMELSAYFDMVYFSIHLVALVWWYAFGAAQLIHLLFSKPIQTAVIF